VLDRDHVRQLDRLARDGDALRLVLVAFTTFTVLSLLAWSDPGTDGFVQRLVETLIGVGAALIATLPARPGPERPQSRS
jgi:hypothetical protein